MEKLPDKVTRIDVLRIEYGIKKMCQCFEPKYEIDAQNRLVKCTECGAIVDPFEALSYLARHYSRIGDQLERLLEERRQIINYQPRRVVIKELEKRYSSADRQNLEPACPRCGEAFELQELLGTGWVNRAFVKRRKQE